MRIIVCVKQVPNTQKIKINEKTGTLIREGIPSILNPFDQFAVEEGIRIKETIGKGEVIVISMGPSQARSALLKCLALGADRAILLTDEAFAGSDTLSTSYTLSLAIKKERAFDLVLCGQQAIDGDTGQVGPELAQWLKIPQITYVNNIEIEKDKVKVRSETHEGYRIVEAKLPLLLALIPSTDFVPGNPPFSKIMKAKHKPFVVLGKDELGGNPNMFGLKGSPTQVKRVFSPPKKEKGVILSGTPDEMTKELANILLKENLL
jgi:electron transfer flavoprotein beta subunit